MWVCKKLYLIFIVLSLGACSSIPSNKYAQKAYLQNAQHNLAHCHSKPSSLQCRTGIQHSLHYEAWYNRHKFRYDSYKTNSHVPNTHATQLENTPNDTHNEADKQKNNLNTLISTDNIDDPIAIQKRHHALSVELLEVLYNSKNADLLFLQRIPDINTRADFFNLNHVYFQSTAMPVRWFAASEHISRRCLFGLGADGCFSHITFTAAKTATHPRLYEWRQVVGDAILQQGFVHFKQLYNQSKTTDQSESINQVHANQNKQPQAGWSKLGYQFNNMPTNPKAFAWDIAQLKREQAIAQPLHQQYLTQPATFANIAHTLTGVDLLKQPSRIKFGCKLMVILMLMAVNLDLSLDVSNRTKIFIP